MLLPIRGGADTGQGEAHPPSSASASRLSWSGHHAALAMIEALGGDPADADHGPSRDAADLGLTKTFSALAVALFACTIVRLTARG